MILSPDPCTSQTATEWELLNKLSSGTGTYASHLHLKRKNSSDEEDDDDDESQPPTKQYISEDKFTDKFNEMSINSQNVTPTMYLNRSFDFTNENSYNEEIMKDMEEEEEESEDEIKKPKCVFSKEMKEAMNSNTVLDKLIREELDKNSKAILLWQPSLIPPLTDLSSNKGEDKSKLHDDQTEAIPIEKSNAEEMIVQ